MNNNSPQYVTKEAIDGLSEKLGLPNRVTQDWEYEVGDSSKVSEYIESYEKIIMSKEEKFALMIIIISSYNDALEEGKIENSIWDKIRHHLLNDISIHRNTILYWALEGEDLENCFSITPFIRQLLDV